MWKALGVALRKEFMRRLSFLFATLLIFTAAIAADDRGTCSERQGTRSIAACTRLISSGRLDAGDQAEIYALRGTAYRDNGQYDLAIADFTQVIQLSEKFASSDVVASAYVVRGSAYSLKGDLEKALADYRAALTLNPNNEQVVDEIKRTEDTLAVASSPTPPSTATTPRIAPTVPAQPLTPLAVMPAAPAARPDNQFISYDNRDLYGGDFRTLKKVDLLACVKACRSDQKCQGYSFDRWNRWCFLKSSISVLSLEPGSVIGVRKNLGEPSLSSAAIRIDQRVGKKFAGRRYSDTTIASLEFCEEACREDPKCLGYTFSRPTKTCGLFEHIDTFLTDKNATSGTKTQSPR